MPIEQVTVSRHTFCTICGGPGVLQASTDRRHVTLCDPCFGRFMRSSSFSVWVEEALAAAQHTTTPEDA